MVYLLGSTKPNSFLFSARRPRPFSTPMYEGVFYPPLAHNPKQAASLGLTNYTVYHHAWDKDSSSDDHTIGTQRVGNEDDGYDSEDEEYSSDDDSSENRSDQSGSEDYGYWNESDSSESELSENQDDSESEWEEESDSDTDSSSEDDDEDDSSSESDESIHYNTSSPCSGKGDKEKMCISSRRTTRGRITIQGKGKKSRKTKDEKGRAAASSSLSHAHGGVVVPKLRQGCLEPKLEAERRQCFIEDIKIRKELARYVEKNGAKLPVYGNWATLERRKAQGKGVTHTATTLWTQYIMGPVRKYAQCVMAFGSQIQRKPTGALNFEGGRVVQTRFLKNADRTRDASISTPNFISRESCSWRMVVTMTSCLRLGGNHIDIHPPHLDQNCLSKDSFIGVRYLIQGIVLGINPQAHFTGEAAITKRALAWRKRYNIINGDRQCSNGDNRLLHGSIIKHTNGQHDVTKSSSASPSKITLSDNYSMNRTSSFIKKTSGSYSFVSTNVPQKSPFPIALSRSIRWVPPPCNRWTTKCLSHDQQRGARTSSSSSSSSSSSHHDQDRPSTSLYWDKKTGLLHRRHEPSHYRPHVDTRSFIDLYQSKLPAAPVPLRIPTALQVVRCTMKFILVSIIIVLSSL